jgi:hypothetical protein
MLGKYADRYNKFIAIMDRDVQRELITEERARELLTRVLCGFITDRVPSFMINGNLDGEVTMKVLSPTRDASSKRDFNKAMKMLADHHHSNFNVKFIKTKRYSLSLTVLIDPTTCKARKILLTEGIFI